MIRVVVLACLCSTALAGVALAQPKKAPPPPAPAAPATSQDKAPTKQRIVGILHIQGPSPEIEAAFEKSLEQQLDTNAYWLSPRSKMRERLRNSTKFTEGCLVGGCLAEVKVQTQAELVLLAAFTGSGTSWGFVVTLVRTDNGRVLSQKDERCDVCTQTEAMNDATLATIGLLNSVPDKLPDAAGDQGAALDLAVKPWEEKVAVERRRTKKVGMILAVSGLVIAAAGVAGYFALDKPDYALATAAGGGGVALGGVLALTF